MRTPDHKSGPYYAPVILLSLVLHLLWSPLALGAADVVTLEGSLLADETSQSRIEVRATIAPGFHINAHMPGERWLIPTELTLDSAGSSFTNMAYPEPIAVEFAFAPGKQLLVYEATILLTATAQPTPTTPILATLRYQACNDTKCLPPTSVSITIGSAKASGISTPGSLNEPGWLEAWLAGASLPARLGMVLLLGLGLNLTPCVYPLISVTLAYFGGQTPAGNSSFRLAIFYVLGITLSFALLGTSAALAGGLFGAPLQNPAVLLSLAAILLALAASCFGLFEFRAPASLVNRVGAAQTGIGGALLMGLTMGIVAAPCIGPVIIGLLLYVGSEKDTWLGFSLFATMGFGMGVPYIALASAAGAIHKLPRAGEWLRWTNRLFGILLIGMAYYFLTPMIPQEWEDILLPLLVAGGSIYLGFFETSGGASPAFQRVKWALGVGGLTLGIWLAVPGEPLAAGIRWQPLTPGALAKAMDAQRPAVIEFGAEWCLPCVEMENTTFKDPEVTKAAQSFAMLQADVTEENETTEMLLREFGVVGVPTIIFYAPDGKEHRRLVGYVSATEMLATLSSVPAPRETPERPPQQQNPGSGVLQAHTEGTPLESVVTP